MGRHCILALDDHPPVIEAVKYATADRDWLVLTAQHFEEAFALLHNHVVDVLLTHYKMAECNGLEIAEFLRKMGSWLENIHENRIWMTFFSGIFLEPQVSASKGVILRFSSLKVCLSHQCHKGMGFKD